MRVLQVLPKLTLHTLSSTIIYDDLVDCGCVLPRYGHRFETEYSKEKKKKTEELKEKKKKENLNVSDSLAVVCSFNDAYAFSNHMSTNHAIKSITLKFYCLSICGVKCTKRNKNGNRCKVKEIQHVDR